MNFKNGILEVEDNVAISMSFMSANKDSKIYQAVEKCLPKINGLKRKDKRMGFTYDFIKELQKQKINISL